MFAKYGIDASIILLRRKCSKTIEECSQIEKIQMQQEITICERAATSERHKTS